jgi:hypothetical protein
MASTRLEKTFTASNRKTFTISTWIKRSALTANNSIYGAGTNDSTDRDYLSFLADSGEEDKLYFNAKVSSSVVAQFYTNRRFRDTSGWYHIVLAFDTTQATDTNRMKLYVNGEQQTFQSQTYPSQNQDMNTNNTVHKIGSTIGNNYYFDGSMSHFHFIDGTAYTASTFGSTDSVTGEWKINTSPSVTYGTNGFFILKDGNSVTDQSGNSNNFTVGGGTLTNTEDNPSNVFNVWNRNFLTRHHNESTSVPGMLQNGNTTFNSTANAFYGYKAGTLGATSGKWYWEGKIIDNGRMYIGICYPNVVAGINEPHYDNQTYSAVTINNAGEVYGRYTGSAIDDYASSVSFANNDIIGFALDMDNKALYIHKNGTYINSGNPASGASRTGSVIEELTGTRDSYLGSGEFVSPFVGDPSSTGTHHTEFNFGNGFFGTTAISSEGTNASGIGKFEYDVPTGYTALSTKGLNL